jgi:hypothetical protein
MAALPTPDPDGSGVGKGVVVVSGLLFGFAIQYGTLASTPKIEL